jgi:membrane-bound lytic murein transglycosylase D
VAKPQQRRYKVRRGDTLSSIAHKLPCANIQEVAEMNNLKHHSLSVGQTLSLPVCR